MLGLIEAAGRYQPSLGVPFEAFARRRVHGAMLDALRDLDWAPRSLRRLRRDVDSAICRPCAHDGQRARRAEIAAELDLSVEAVRARRGAAAHAGAGHGARTRRARQRRHAAHRVLHRSRREAPSRRSSGRSCAPTWRAPSTQLPERERHILALYYEEEMTLAEIGEAIGVCESRVCQLRGVAVARLRTLLRVVARPAGGTAREQDPVAGRNRRAARVVAARGGRGRRGRHRRRAARSSSATTSGGRTASRRSSCGRCTSCTTGSRTTSRPRCRCSCGR